jgi:parvulin-like peptidyl-prolyl isomerase
LESQELDDAVAITVGEEQVSLAEVLRVAKWRGETAFVTQTVDYALCSKYAEANGIEVTDDELQEAADTFRSTRDLETGALLLAWLKERRLSVEDWEELLEADLLRRKVRDAVTDSGVPQMFAEHKTQFDSAEISWMVVGNEDISRELRAQIQDEGADFHALARQFSTDLASKPSGGYLGGLARNAIDPLLQPYVFGGKAGQVVGPIKTDEGWTLVKIERISRATLSEAAREQIKDYLFTEWLTARREEAAVTMPILDL